MIDIITAMAPTRKPATEEKRVLIRFQPDTYNAVSAAATLAGKSLNELVNETLHNTFCTTSAPPVQMLAAVQTFYGNALVSNATANSPGVSVSAPMTYTYSFSQIATNPTDISVSVQDNSGSAR